MANIATSLNQDIVKLIDERATKLGITRGAMLRNIITNWYEQGCQPVNLADNALHLMAAEESVSYSKPPAPKYDGPMNASVQKRLDETFPGLAEARKQAEAAEKNKRA